MKKSFFIKKIILLLVTVLIVSCFVGCGGNKATNKTQKEKTMVFASTEYFCNEGMDPAKEWDGWYINYYGVSETLFKLDNEFKAKPVLVDSYKQVDDNTWKITLRDDVKFHNGKKMTAESVKKCFERTIKVNERAARESWLGSMKAEGQVLTIKTTKPTPTLANNLTDPLWIVYYAEGNDNYAENTYFTGPYKIESFKANEKTTVVKNKDYYGDKPKLDKAVFKTIADDNALAMAIQNGEVDMGVAVSSSSIPLFHDKSKYKVDSVTSTRGQFLLFNMGKDVVKDIAVRNAISMCIDRENYEKKISNGTIEASYGIYSSNLAYGGTDGLNLTVMKKDLEGAKKLLKEAGYKDTNNNGILDKDGLELSMKLIIGSNGVEMLQLCEDLQSNLSEIGIQLKIEPMEKIADASKSGDFDICCTSYGMAPTGSAEYFIDLMFASKGTGNQGHYKNVKVDKLSEKLSTTYDKEERIKIIKEIEQEVLNDSAFIFFGHQKFTCVYNNKVIDFKTNPSEYYALDQYTDIRK